MLSEEEFQFVMSFLSAETGVPFGERQQQALDAYQQITGERESKFPALCHHRLALYGAICQFCRRPLRTPRANLCGNCMKHVPAATHRVN